MASSRKGIWHAIKGQTWPADRRGGERVTPGDPALFLATGVASGLMIGIERGWRLRDEIEGSRVAGVRTFALLGGSGALCGLLSSTVSPLMATAIVAALVVGLVIAFARDTGRKDSTSFVATILALAIGLLSGAGQPALAIASGAVVTFILATRAQSHAFVQRLNNEDVHAFARYAVIVAAVLPFLPNRQMGPLDAWNPFQLWLVVVLVTGFSFAGYIANRTIGARRGMLATAIIGGAYSSTAVTASLARRLGKDDEGPLTAGIALASAVMYVRVIGLIAVLTAPVLPAFLLTVGPATLSGALVAGVAWMRSPRAAGARADAPGNPIELAPAFGFVAIVAAGAILTKWAQIRFGESGTAISLFITGSVDVDAAIVTLAGLPAKALSVELAALAIGATMVANMMMKIGLVALYAGRRGSRAMVALATSTLVLLGTLIWRGPSLALF